MKVLPGVKEHQALYPKRHSLEAEALGMSVKRARRMQQMAAALKMRGIMAFSFWV
jgi:hypothetical protein